MPQCSQSYRNTRRELFAVGLPGPVGNPIYHLSLPKQDAVTSCFPIFAGRCPARPPLPTKNPRWRCRAVDVWLVAGPPRWYNTGRHQPFDGNGCCRRGRASRWRICSFSRLRRPLSFLRPGPTISTKSRAHCKPLAPSCARDSRGLFCRRNQWLATRQRGSRQRAECSPHSERYAGKSSHPCE